MTLNNYPLKDYQATAGTFTATFQGTAIDLTGLDVTRMEIRTDIGDPVTVFVGYNHIRSICRYPDADTTVVEITVQSTLADQVEELNTAVDFIIEEILGGGEQ